MSRVSDILDRARDTLADPKEERWTTERLVRLVDEAQRDIAIHTKLFKNEADIYPTAKLIKLPDDVIILRRAMMKAKPIQLMSHDEMDRLGTATDRRSSSDDRGYTRDFDIGSGVLWETDTGEVPTALIYDLRNMDELRVYPIPEFEATEDIFGVLIPEDPTSGIFGVVNQGFGVTITASDAVEPIHIWYTSFPAAVTGTASVLSLSSLWDTALKNYVIAHAYDDDYDSKFPEKSQKALALYERDLLELMAIKSRDGVKQTKNLTEYVGAFQ